MRFLQSVLILGFVLGLNAAPPPVRIWEEPLTIPTYETGAPDPTPLFYDGRTYQGAKGPVYPYPITDKINDVMKDKVYRAVYIENEYIKICVLPELGGRIFSAVDKTNGYDFFYRQHVIKPALIGMVGAWISGGVEWNIPHHHRASSFMPVEYKLEELPDGGKTLWVGEMELRHRMRWLVGLTLRPGEARLEATVKLINGTPLAHSFLYFANVSVHANDNYQVIFPPGTSYATQHSKVEFSEWPVSRQVYGGVDFTGGVDVSWWKNHPRPTSMFAWNHEDDFLAGYDHGKKAGTLHVAEHGIVPGKKFFAWGNGDEGRMWDKILTDRDGPYLELMVGGYSDNQPDYSWIQPYEVKTIHEAWYPFQQIGGVKLANRDAAVNLEVTSSGAATIGIYVTREYPAARVRVKGLLPETVAIAPGKPYLKRVQLQAGVTEQDLRVSLESDGREVIAYQPRVRQPERTPEPVQRPLPPARIQSAEELYLAGQRLEQFYSPAAEPDPYYEEALKRDPADVRANTALGLLYYRRGLFTAAEEKLRSATARLTKNYTSPRDGESLYYLGLALQAQNKLDAAREVLYKATWSSAQHTAANYALAQIAGLQGRYADALEFVDRALETNGQNTKALALRASLLRHLGRGAEAVQAASASLKVDPLDTWSTRERQPDAFAINTSAGIQDYLEMAVDYASAGLKQDAIAVLTALASSKAGAQPMVYYWLADLSGPEGAPRFYGLATKASPDYCFPFRLESIGVLRRAIEKNPADARAPYYLGNLLYDLQPAEAIKAWEVARRLDSGSALVHRNLAFAYARVEKDNRKALASLEEAITRLPDARFLYERDQLAERAGLAPAERLKMLEARHTQVLERDDALSREIRLHVDLGHYVQALSMLASRKFHPWEGGGRFSVHETFVEAHLLRGGEQLKAGHANAALLDFQGALEYPDNLAVGRPYAGDRTAEIHYLIGLAHEAAGSAAQARSAFEASAAQTRTGRDPDVLYAQGCALLKLGKAAPAADIFAKLVETGTERLKSAGAETDYFAKFGDRPSRDSREAQAHYVLGLGYLGQGKRTEAAAEFHKALSLDPGDARARQRAELR